MQLETLFGGRVRAGTLETLAVTSKPLSAYRIAKAIGAEPVQVSAVLRGLEPLVEHLPTGWVLRNDPLRRLVSDEVRAKDSARRKEKDALLGQLGLKPSHRNERRRV